MTICIAAKSLRDHCVVSIADRMLSYDDFVPATENAAEKLLLVSGNWRAMIAGDIRYALPVIGRVRASFSGENTVPYNPSLAEMKDPFRAAYQAELQQQVTDKFLGRYGLSFEMFRRDGYQFLGPQEFSKLNESIRSFELDIEFLVYGLGKADLSHIFGVENPGIVIDHDLSGFAAIGSGYHMAMGVLAARPITQLSVEQLIYRLCEAKFTSETAHGVGKETTLLCLSSNGIAGTFDTDCINNLSAAWERERNAEAPIGTMQIIREAYKKIG